MDEEFQIWDIPRYDLEYIDKMVRHLDALKKFGGAYPCFLQMKLTHLVNWWANDGAKYKYNYVGTEKLHLETWYSTFYSATRDICSNFDLLVENC